MKLSFIKLVFILLLAVFSFHAIAQRQNIDSIENAIKNLKADSTKVFAINNFIKTLLNGGEIDKAKVYNNESKTIALKLKDSPDPLIRKAGKKGLAIVYTINGFLAMDEGGPQIALKNYDTSLVFAKEANDKVVMAYIYGNIGLIHKQQGVFPKALEYYFLALKMLQEAGNKKGEVVNLGNIGTIYNNLKDFDKAMEYYNKAMKISEEEGFKKDIADNQIRIGNIYETKKDYVSALKYYNDGLAFFESAGLKSNVALVLGSIALLYDAKAEYETALEYYFRSLSIYQEIGKKNSQGIQLENIGAAYKALKQYKKSEEYLLKALKITEEVEDLTGIMSINKHLSELYELTNNSEKSLAHYKLYIAARDSIFNEENTKKMVRSEMNFDFEKKEAAAKLEQEKKEAVAEAESKKQRIIIWSVCGILLLVIGFAVFAYRSFLQKKKANVEITMQKHIIEEKQKEILDSIHYAKRIQTALLPTEKYIERNLEEMMK